MKQQSIPDHLTKDFLVECLNSDVEVIKSAAQKKVALDNITSDTPMINLLDKIKTQYTTPNNWACIVFQMCEQLNTPQAYQKGFEILKHLFLLDKQSSFVFLILCDLLQRINSVSLQKYCNKLSIEVIEVLKKYSLQYPDTCIAKLFYRTQNNPQLSNVILYKLENSSDLAKTTQKISIDCLRCYKASDTEVMIKTYYILIPFMDIQTLELINRILHYDNKIEELNQAIYNRCIELLSTSTDTHYSILQCGCEIAYLLPVQYGSPIFRKIYIHNPTLYGAQFISYICQTGNRFPHHDLKFIAQNLGAQDNHQTEEYINIYEVLSDELRNKATNFDHVSQLVNWICEDKELLQPALLQSSQSILLIAQTLQHVCNVQQARIEQIGMLHILPSPNPPLQDKYKELIILCKNLINDLYIAAGFSGTICANIILSHPHNWQQLLQSWDINSKDFQQDFLSGVSQSQKAFALEVEKYFCNICNIQTMSNQDDERKYINKILQLLNE